MTRGRHTHRWTLRLVMWMLVGVVATVALTFVAWRKVYPGGNMEYAGRVAWPSALRGYLDVYHAFGASIVVDSGGEVQDVGGMTRWARSAPSWLDSAQVATPQSPLLSAGAVGVPFPCLFWAKSLDLDKRVARLSAHHGQGASLVLRWRERGSKMSVELTGVPANLVPLSVRWPALLGNVGVWAAACAASWAGLRLVPRWRAVRAKKRLCRESVSAFK